jgi:hypothetical protein
VPEPLKHSGACSKGQPRFCWLASAGSIRFRLWIVIEFPSGSEKTATVSVGDFPRRFRTARRLDSDTLFPQSAFALNLRGSPDFGFSCNITRRSTGYWGS